MDRKDIITDANDPRRCDPGEVQRLKAKIKRLEEHCKTMMERDEVDSIIEYRDRIFAEKDARIKELEAERLAILGIIESAPELNPCNYTHDEAMTINIALIDIFRLLEGK